MRTTAAPTAGEGTWNRGLVESPQALPRANCFRRSGTPSARSTDATGLPRGADTGRGPDSVPRTAAASPACGAPLLHRGTTLHYGRVETDGPLRPTRMAVRGGRHLPGPPLRAERGRNRASTASPGIRCREYNGLIFTYMGPATDSPCSPATDIFRICARRGDRILDHFAFGGPSEAGCNWFQTHENAMDPYHVFILHNAISGHQFDPKLEIWPRIDWQRHTCGVTASQDRDLADGTVLHRVTEIRVPTIRAIPTPTLTVLGKTNNMSWAVPIDDTRTKVLAMVRKPRDRPPQGLPVYADGKNWFELDEEGHQRLSRTTRPRSARGRSRCTHRAAASSDGECRWCGDSSSTQVRIVAPIRWGQLRSRRASGVAAGRQLHRDAGRRVPGPQSPSWTSKYSFVDTNKQRRSCPHRSRRSRPARPGVRSSLALRPC